MTPASRLQALAKGTGERSHSVTLCPRRASVRACQRPTTPAPRMAMLRCWPLIASSLARVTSRSDLISERHAFTAWVGAACEPVRCDGDDAKAAGEGKALDLMAEFAHAVG